MHRDLSPGFERFVLERSTMLLRTAVLLVGDRGLAEDLVQLTTVVPPGFAEEK